ncbi:hypothetical protein ACROYT_G013641 [Oculina patagonica]
MAHPLHVGDREVSQDEIKYLEREARDYCLTHGMFFNDSKGEPQHVPFTLFPSPFPQKLFTAAKKVQTDFNLLVHKVSQDYEFTKKALSSTVAADPFTSRLFDIYEKVLKRENAQVCTIKSPTSSYSTVAADPFTSRLFDIYGKVLEQGNAQPISLGIFRSDYLIDTSGGLHNQCCGCNSSDKNAAGPIYIKQVEMNTIALGGISFSCLVPSMHRYLLHLKGQENKVPANPALDEAADGLIRAWELYGSKSAVIMFVVQPGEVNVYDQRLLEYRIHERNGGIKVIRRSLNDIFNDGKTDNEKSLFVNGLEVAVAYFRAGYTPKDYPTENEWSARLTLELSRCIKCPTVAHQLMGTKKIQQVLAEPGVLERFLPDKESVARVRRTFTGLYTLDPVMYTLPSVLWPAL